MAEKKSKISKLFDKYLAKMNSIKREKHASQLYHELTRGKTSYMKLDRLATSYFDMTWIKAIEDVLFDLGDIVKNPREVTKTEAVLVPVELARKTNSESVRHLASHTQYIKTVNEDGEVIPNKIITIANEEDIHTYENRFIATLIRRLVLFIEKRYEFIKSFTPLSDEQILYFKNSSIVNGAEVEIETKIKILAESETNISEISNKYISRIEDIREYVLYYYTSPFMKKLKTDRDVRNPIILTNILRKNPKYHKCYELYRFIERYQQLGVSYKVDERVSLLDEEEIDELNTVMFTNYLAIQDAEHSKKVKENTKVYKPKILTSIDDEQFVYGDLLKGPFNFVRIDDEYQAYLDSKIKKDLPIHPTKVEREYYETEYAEKKERKEDKVQIEKLKKRKSKEALENEKRIKKIIEEREREEALRRQQEEEARRLEEERRLDEVRREIIAAARGEMPEEEPEEVPTEEVLSEPAQEETPVEEANVEETPSSSREPIEYDFSNIKPQPKFEYEDIYSDEDKGEESVETYIINSEVDINDIKRLEEDYDLFEEVEEKTKEDNKSKKSKKRLVTISDFKDVKQKKESDYEDIFADDTDGDSDVEKYIINTEIEKLSIEDVEALLASDTLLKKEPKKEKKARKPKKTKEEKPVDEPVQEPVIEEVPVEEEPVSNEEEKPQEEAPQAEPAEEPSSKEEKPSKKPSKKKQAPKKEKKQPKKEEPKEELETIPGRFIVKTLDGYYVKEGKYSIYKHEAFIFDDFNKANAIKKRLGGKVVKL